MTTFLTCLSFFAVAFLFAALVTELERLNGVNE